MYSGNASRNSIRISSRKKSHVAIGARSPFPEIANMMKNNSKDMISYKYMRENHSNSRKNLLIRDMRKAADSESCFNSQNYVENFIMKSKQIKRDRISSQLNKSEEKVIKFSKIFKDLKKNAQKGNSPFQDIISRGKDSHLKRSQNYSVDYNSLKKINDNR